MFVVGRRPCLRALQALSKEAPRFCKNNLNILKKFFGKKCKVDVSGLEPAAAPVVC